MLRKLNINVIIIKNVNSNKQKIKILKDNLVIDYEELKKELDIY